MSENDLCPLLDHLVHNRPDSDAHWQGWQIKPVRGGMNSLLYHVTNASGDYAIKLAARDARNRAGREYRALQFLKEHGLAIAPEPIFLDTDSYPQQVIVQSWLDGAVHAAPPADDAEWDALLQHYTAIHALTPTADMPPAVLNFGSAQDGIEIVGRQMAYLPEPPAALTAIWQRLQAAHFPVWPNQSNRVVRTDPNTLNFVRRPSGWASVDWENSGWGDPAFEIADMMAHPQYMTVPDSRWQWVIQRYAALTGSKPAERIDGYYRILLVWWVARLARSLYEIPRGLDQRLAQRPPDWQAETEAKYIHYLRLAEAL